MPDMLPSPGHRTLADAIRRHMAGQSLEAESICREILAATPNHADAMYLLSVIAGQAGRLVEAIDLLRRAIAVLPNNYVYHCDLAGLLQSQGRLDEAIAAYQRVLELKPDLAHIHNNLGIALKDKGQLEQAIACHQRALALAPEFAEAHTNLGIVWMLKGDFDRAIACHEQAVKFQPEFVDAHNNLGVAWNDKGRLDQAIACFRRALAIQGEFLYAHLNLGNALLATGQFTDGWSEYEWRWKNPGFESKPSFAQPVWDGSNHAGTVLLTAEQGFGDTIQFIRYAPLVAARCRRVLLQCHRELVPLLDGAPGLAGVMSRGQALPDFDVHCTLMTLPRLFATTLDTIPARVPYLNAEPARVAAWGAKLGETRRFKIGLAWAGSEAHKNDQHRSMPLSAFASLSAIPGTLFVSLQKGPAALQIQSSPDGMELIDPTADLHDFADTAALIANLDLVISVDTAMVHLAGALAKPVWTLLPLVPDWRWLLNRSDSPWYPTMRLFRQPALGDWSAVMQRVAADLRRFMGEQGSRSPEPL